MAVTLAGFAVAGALHTANHAVDHHLGGYLGDFWGMGALTVLALLGLLAHPRRRPSNRQAPKGDT